MGSRMAAVARGSAVGAFAALAFAAAGAPARADTEPTHDPTRTAASVALDAGVTSRRFAYHEPVTANLRPYAVTFAPTFALHAAIAPFAPFARDSLRDVGLFADYARLVGIRSATLGGAPVDTSASDLTLGAFVRARPTGVLSLSGSFAYAARDFVIGAPAPLASEVASVSYRSLRPAIDLRFSFPRVALLAGAGYRMILAGGEVASRFPRANVGGLDVTLGVAVPVGAGFEPRLSVRYERYFYAMNPEPGDAYIAGGALDELASFELGLAYVF